MLDKHDQYGDRFRYPTERNHDSYASSEADLEELYRAYDLIASSRDAVCEEIRVRRDVLFWSHRCDGIA